MKSIQTTIFIAISRSAPTRFTDLVPAPVPFAPTRFTALKLVLAIILIVTATTALQAQSTQTQPAQTMPSGQPSMPQSRTSAFAKSPLDMCYYPADYPVLRIQDKPMEPLIARVVYSRPQKQGRRLFGDLVEYGKVWRLGANEATEIEFFKDIKIDNKKVKKGRYTLYALVEADKWTLILNKDTDTWGAFRYDQSKDVLRVSEPVEKSAEVTEAFYMQFQKVNKGAALFIYWDDVMVKLPISW